MGLRVFNCWERWTTRPTWARVRGLETYCCGFSMIRVSLGLLLWEFSWAESDYAQNRPSSWAVRLVKWFWRCLRAVSFMRFHFRPRTGRYWLFFGFTWALSEPPLPAPKVNYRGCRGLRRWARSR